MLMQPSSIDLGLDSSHFEPNLKTSEDDERYMSFLKFRVVIVCSIEDTWVMRV